MGRTGAFLEVERREHGMRPAEEATKDYDEITVLLPLDEQQEQAARCMECGVGFCQSGITLEILGTTIGCPLQNAIPETNDLLYRNRLDDAADRLLMTNPFPEFTSRVCPAPCEAACNLGLNSEAVTIHDNERALADYAWERGMKPLEAPSADAPLIAVIGSGPAGLACAWELCRQGLRVRVIERAKRAGGLLTYGIPSMKLPKDIVERRITLMEQSGIEFKLGVNDTAEVHALTEDAAAVVLACGATQPRDMDIPGRSLEGIHFAVDYLTEVTDAELEDRPCAINANGKDVVVIGGGDTGTDCVACALRQGARSVTQVIRAQAPALLTDTPWPRSRTGEAVGYGQREANVVYGHDPRMWSTDTLSFAGEDGSVSSVEVCDLDENRQAVGGTNRQIPAQLVLIAKGFVGPEKEIFDAFAAQVSNECHRSPADHGTQPVYVTGDARGGASIVAQAMAEGMLCANEVVEDISGF